MVMVGACGSTGLEVIVAASALGIKQHIFIPPLAEAWYGAAEIRIAKVTANGPALLAASFPLAASSLVCA